MKQPRQWYFDDKFGKYIVIHLAMQVIAPFLQRILRRQIIGGCEEEIDGERYPAVVSYHVFIDPRLRLGYIVLMFAADCQPEILDNYSRRLRRRYQVINNISLGQLNSLASPKNGRLCSVPQSVYPASYHDSSDGVMLWLMQEHDEPQDDKNE